MSMPTLPSSTDISRQNAINQIISSIAHEEVAMSHVINAEGEKIQFALGTLEGLSGDASLEDILNVNSSVNSTIDTALENQMLLNGKLGDALSAPVFYGVTGPTGPIGVTGSDEGPIGPIGPIGAVDAYII